MMVNAECGSALRALVLPDAGASGGVRLLRAALLLLLLLLFFFFLFLFLGRSSVA
jgi:hypothetical protein